MPTLPLFQYALGTSPYDLEYLAVLGVTSNPLATYQPYAVADELGDLSLEGNGFPIVTWHWDFLPIGEADILRDFLNGNLSASVYLTSLINPLTTKQYTWVTWSGIMKWMTGAEDLRSRKVFNVDITFAGLLVVTL